MNSNNFTTNAPTISKEQSYEMFESLRYTKGKGMTETFGIMCMAEDATAPIILSDISSMRSEVEGIVETLNRAGVSSVHFLDVVQDMME